MYQKKIPDVIWGIIKTVQNFLEKTVIKAKLALNGSSKGALKTRFTSPQTGKDGLFFMGPGDGKRCINLFLINDQEGNLVRLDYLVFLPQLAEPS